MEHVQTSPKQLSIERVYHVCLIKNSNEIQIKISIYQFLVMHIVFIDGMQDIRTTSLYKKEILSFLYCYDKCNRLRLRSTSLIICHRRLNFVFNSLIRQEIFFGLKLWASEKVNGEDMEGNKGGN